MIQALPAPAASAPFDPEEQRRWDEALRLAGCGWRRRRPCPGRSSPPSHLRRADWAEAALKALPADRAGGGPPRERGRRRHVGAGRGRRDGVPPRGPALRHPARRRGGPARPHAQRALRRAPAAPGHGAIPVLPENVAAFEQAAGIPGDQLRLWIAARQLARRRVVEGADWLVGHLAALLEQVAAATDPGRPAWPTASRAST